MSDSGSDVEDFIDIFGQEGKAPRGQNNPQRSAGNDGISALLVSDDQCKMATQKSTRAEQARGGLSKPHQAVMFGFKIKRPRCALTETEAKTLGKRGISTSTAHSIPRRELEKLSKGLLKSWYLQGVITARSGTRLSKKQSNYCIWTLGDLTSEKSTAKVMLFGSAYEKFWKETEGHVVAILGPELLANQESHSNGLTFSVNEDWNIIVAGFSADYSTCRATRKDGKPCPNAIDQTKCQFCEFHVLSEMAKIKQQQRKQTIKPRTGPSLPRSFTVTDLRTSKNNQIIGGNANDTKESLANKKWKSAEGLTKHPSKPNSTNSILNPSSTKKTQMKSLREKTTRKPLLMAQGLPMQDVSKAVMNRPLKRPASNMTKKADTTVLRKNTGLQEKEDALSRNAEHQRKRDGAQISAASHQPRLVGLDSKPNHLIEKDLLGQLVSRKKPKAEGGPTSDTRRPCISQPPSVGIPKESRVFGSILSVGGHMVEEKKSKWREFNGLASVDKAKVRAKQLQASILANSVVNTKKMLIMKKQHLGTNRNTELLRLRGDQSSGPFSLFGCKGVGNTMDQILERKSRYAANADEQLDDRLVSKLSTLENKENIAEKASSLHKFKVKVIICRDCKKMYEEKFCNPLCLQQGHSMYKKQAWKRFFMCQKCKGKTTCVGEILPSAICSKCGTNNWEKTSAFGKEVSYSLAPRLFTAMSEHTRLSDRISLEQNS